MEQSSLSYKDVVNRPYMLRKDIYIKYQNKREILNNIKKGLSEFVFAGPAVRFVLNNKKSNSVRTILGLPFPTQRSKLLDNFAALIYHPIMGYYVQGDIQTSHSGISSLLIEGNLRNLLRRETENLIDLAYKRGDVAGRVLKSIEINESARRVRIGSSFVNETIRDGLEIHIGYRIFTRGEGVNPTRIFIPIAGSNNVVNQIFKNLEEMLQHTFSTYDEIGTKPLVLTESLIFKDLESILERSKEKDYTRKKILQKLVFDKDNKIQNRVYKDNFYNDQSGDIGKERMKYGRTELKGKQRGKIVNKRGKLSKIEKEEEHLKVPSRATTGKVTKNRKLIIKKESLQELDE